MSGKRSATSDLNHDNWNQDDEPEERGTFQKASVDTLKSRVIRTAKRRNPISSVRTEEDGKKSAFAGFTGFQSKPASTDFSFLAGISKSDSAPKTNGIDKSDTAKSANFNIFTNTSTTSKTNIFGATPTTTSISASTSVVAPSSSTTTNKSDNYCSKLKGLNESVSNWITKKVEENPLISLTPIFKDYEKYLEEIEKEEKSTKGSVSQNTAAISVPSFNFTTSSNSMAVPDSTSEKNSDKKAESLSIPAFKFGAPATSSVASTLGSTVPTFSFGSTNNGPTSKPFSTLSTSSSTLSATPTFSFGSNNSSSGSLTFPTSTGLNFGSAAKSAETENPKENNDEEDTPPKVEFKTVVEKDHVFTTKCKVFVKKGDNFGDRGVGNLYLKPIENSEKVQLIVRADTNLGNLLLNFILSENVPTKRMGKKDIMLVAIPTPDSQPPPVPLLLRVKSPEDADNLLQVLEKHKK